MTEFAPPTQGDGIELAPRVFAPASAMRWQFARSSGPGGQNVNKVNTKAELWVPVTVITGLRERAVSRLRAMAGRRLTTSDEIHIASDTERTQESNREAVMQRLRELLLEAMHEPKPRRKTKPSRAAKQRRLDSKKRRSTIKAHRRGLD
ncbi:MAG TPA: alternative ribosome rescue aminoacyl-tRNA hydrolase ArfB [Tepidisphaeraceae bacterium]|nr:alternative ribosome rescue aminoacyl-tRNA hydrolase ArfB [Tepidisphaeraceae bacterium]